MEDPFDLDSRDMNLIEKLINEVKNRPLLWDRYDNDYNNRGAMDHEWEKIAMVLKKDKDFVKQKWRNLRDQFQRESKKVKVPFDNPTKPYIQYYRGKWIYFEHMLFLKDITYKRTSTCYSPPQEIEIREDDIKEEIIEFEDDIFAEQVNIYNNDSDNYEREPSINSPTYEESQSTIQAKVEIVDDGNSDEQTEEMGRKRKASECTPEAVKSKRPSVVDTTSNTEESNEIDDDLHFVKSLVPYLRKLSPIRKLLVRNEIQNLLIRESLCDKCKLGKMPVNNQ